jgi:AraC-like DNA-binding protein
MATDEPRKAPKPEGKVNADAPPVRVALADCSIARPAAFGGAVEIVLARAVPRGFGARVSGGLGVCLKWGAAHEVRSDGRHLTYPADAICVRHPGCVWSSNTASVAFLSIDIAPSLLPRGLRAAPMRFTGGAGLNLRGLAAAIEHGSSALAQDGALATLVEWLAGRDLVQAEELREDSPRQRAIRRAREFLAQTFADNPSLDQLAAATGTNKFVLLRYFKRELGLAPHGYLIHLRVERARQLLANGCTPADAAAEVGFSDQGHFGRHFRRVLGITPAAYRRQARSLVSVPSAAVNFVRDPGAPG